MVLEIIPALSPLRHLFSSFFEYHPLFNLFPEENTLTGLPTLEIGPDHAGPTIETLLQINPHAGADLIASLDRISGSLVFDTQYTETLIAADGRPISIPAKVGELFRTGQIDQATYDDYIAASQAYTAARDALSKEIALLKDLIRTAMKDGIDGREAAAIMNELEALKSPIQEYQQTLASLKREISQIFVLRST